MDIDFYSIFYRALKDIEPKIELNILNELKDNNKLNKHFDKIVETVTISTIQRITNIEVEKYFNQECLSQIRRFINERIYHVIDFKSNSKNIDKSIKKAIESINIEDILFEFIQNKINS